MRRGDFQQGCMRRRASDLSGVPPGAMHLIGVCARQLAGAPVPHDLLPCEGSVDRLGGPAPWQAKTPCRTRNALPSQSCRRAAGQPSEGTWSICYHHPLPGPRLFGPLAPGGTLQRNCHRLSRDGRIRTIGLSVLVSQLAPPLQRSTSFFHSRVACVRAMDFLARSSCGTGAPTSCRAHTPVRCIAPGGTPDDSVAHPIPSAILTAPGSARTPARRQVWTPALRRS